MSQRTLRLENREVVPETADWENIITLNLECLHCGAPFAKIEFVPPINGNKHEIFVGKVNEAPLDLSYEEYSAKVCVGLCLECTKGNYFRKVGFKKGYQKAREKDNDVAREEGYERGFFNGKEEGWEEGRQVGIEEGIGKARQQLMTDLQEVADMLHHRINRLRNGEGYITLDPSNMSNSTEFTEDGDEIAF